MARRYTVYSKTNGHPWHAVTVDLEELATAAGDLVKTENLLAPRMAEPPEWISEGTDPSNHLNVQSLESGTVIVLEDLDRLRKTTGWVQSNTLEAKLLQNFGVIYRHWLADKRIMVNGKKVQVVDPLFLMQQGRYYDETPIRAKLVHEHAFEAPAGDKIGHVRIRAALLPPDFQLANPEDYGRRGGKNNKRHEIMKFYNGILICREGRQIDCITPEWTKFQNYDYNVKIEIDFDPVLDEHFGITTAKQQIVIDDWMWEKLKQTGKEHGGLQALIKDIREELNRMRDRLEAALNNSEGRKEEPRPSETAMADAERFRVRRVAPTPAKVSKARENLDEEVKKISRQTGKPAEEVRPALEEKTNSRAYQVEFEFMEEGPFYIPKRMGQLQKRIVINTAHPFYTKMYSEAPEIKSALEVMLFVLADGELDADGEREDFYKSERQHWSTMLRHALDRLEDKRADKVSMEEERKIS
jgi:hypothetical protein